MMIGNFFKKKQYNWENNRQYLKSKIDLILLPEQVIYVEGKYHSKIHKIFTNKYDEIASKLNSPQFSADFIYLPVVAQQLQNLNELHPFLSYYFPNIGRKNGWLNRQFDRRLNQENGIYQRLYERLSTTLQTSSISNLLFSFLNYIDEIKPGFFRYVGKDKENFFIYEYFSFESSEKSLLLKQIDYYADSLLSNTEFSFPSVEEDGFLFDDIRPEEDKFSAIAEDFTSYEDIQSQKYEASARIFGKVHVPENSIPIEGHELIARIKSDLRDLKDLGFYELLLKEIGSMLYEIETNKPFQPSRLVIDDEFKILLPDFDNMEIVMTPLPKTLFILFLRHPDGIHLSSLIDYKKELLEIYKLLSYRETYLDMVESIDRICNPLESSINEKLSRIKEAFKRKMSMDTAKYYIVAGERGMNKKIEIDRSLVQLPNVFEEIELTKISE